MNFEGKSFLKLLDFTPEEISALIDLAATLKEKNGSYLFGSNRFTDWKEGKYS